MLEKIVIIFLGWGRGGVIAFRRETVWESLCVGTVIVYHVILLHPFHLLSASPSYPSPGPSTCGGHGDGIWTARRCSRRCDAEVPVGCSEGCLTPVCLEQPTSGSPVIIMPQTTFYLHRLVLGVWNPYGLRVLELSDRNAIYRQAETHTHPIN